MLQQFDVRILINAQTLAPPRGCKFAKFASQIGPYPFSKPLGQYKAHNVEHLLVTLGGLKSFLLSSLPFVAIYC
jgi:hypothetical protein